MLMWSIQLYADFTGGIDITIGIAKSLGNTSAVDKIAETVRVESELGTSFSAAEISRSLKYHVKTLCRLTVAAENYFSVLFEIALSEVHDYLVP